MAKRRRSKEIGVPFDVGSFPDVVRDGSKVFYVDDEPRPIRKVPVKLRDALLTPSSKLRKRKGKVMHGLTSDATDTEIDALVKRVRSSGGS